MNTYVGLAEQRKKVLSNIGRGGGGARERCTYQFVKAKVVKWSKDRKQWGREAPPTPVELLFTSISEAFINPPSASHL